MQPSHTNVLVLGAGPAGLAAGYHLKERGIPCLILEKGTAPGNSWRQMPTNLKLISPWKTNSLPQHGSNGFPRHYQVSRVEYADYLQRYADQVQLPIRAGVTVKRIEKNPRGEFLVHTALESFSCRILLNATGYFSNPVVPEIPGADQTRIAQMHVAQYKDPAALRRQIGKPSGKVLIVGKRLSAGQTMVELHQAGFEVAFSARDRIQFGVGRLAWWFFYRAFPWFEWLALKLPGQRKRTSAVPMQGGAAKQLIRSGCVKVFPAIRRFERDAAVFDDGTRFEADAIIYATGFQPALRHLDTFCLAFDREKNIPVLNELESASVPGLFFLGLDRSRTFRSRFIRGIREDAAFVVKRIAQRLTTT
jgi:putative flavoprotein involved in K+ transport